MMVYHKYTPARLSEIEGQFICDVASQLYTNKFSDNTINEIYVLNSDLFSGFNAGEIITILSGIQRRYLLDNSIEEDKNVMLQYFIKYKLPIFDLELYTALLSNDGMLIENMLRYSNTMRADVMSFMESDGINSMNINSIINMIDNVIDTFDKKYALFTYESLLQYTSLSYDDDIRNEIYAMVNNYIPLPEIHPYTDAVINRLKSFSFEILKEYIFTDCTLFDVNMGIDLSIITDVIEQARIDTNELLRDNAKAERDADLKRGIDTPERLQYYAMSYFEVYENPNMFDTCYQLSLYIFYDILNYLLYIMGTTDHPLVMKLLVKFGQLFVIKKLR